MFAQSSLNFVYVKINSLLSLSYVNLFTFADVNSCVKIKILKRYGREEHRTFG